MSSRIRALQQYMALQQEIARRLNRPIDLEDVALDGEALERSLLEQDNNSLIPVGPEMIQDISRWVDQPSVSDYAMNTVYRQGMQEKLREARKQGGVISGPMLASVMQLDR